MNIVEGIVFAVLGGFALFVVGRKVSSILRVAALPPRGAVAASSDLAAAELSSPAGYASATSSDGCGSGCDSCGSASP